MGTTIAIIEDDISIRESLQIFIASKTVYAVSNQYDNAEDFFKDQVAGPSMLLLDIGLPGMSGLEALPKIKEKFPSTEVIMLTTYEEDDKIFEALCNGASSYISKRTPLLKIMDALHVVKEGGSYMSPSIAKKVTQFFKKPKKETIALSERQTEIVKLLVEGLSYKEIAAECFISMNTVRTHIKRIYTLLEINSKPQLIKKYHDGEIS